MTINILFSSHQSLGYKILSTLTSPQSLIQYIWAKFSYKPLFNANEVKLFAQQNAQNEDIEKIVQLLLRTPVLLNIRISQAYKLYLLEKKLFGKEDLNYEKGLNILKDLSFGISKIRPIHTELSNKISNILLSDIQSLKEKDKLSKKHFYFIYLAHKSYEVYKKLQIHNFSPELETYFRVHREFFDNCDQLIAKTWREIQLDNKSILFFIDREYQKTIGKTKKLEKTYEAIRRGEATHTAFIHTKLNERPKQIHITINCYEENHLRIIDLLSSKFISLDLTKFLTKDASKYLKLIFNHDDINFELDQLWEKIVSNILENSADLTNIKNSFFRRAMSVLKWFGMSCKTGIDSKSQKMICSEFVINLLEKILNDMEIELIKTYETKYSDKLKKGMIFNHPFHSINACNMTPGDVFKALIPFRNQKKVGSKFLESIILSQ